MASKTRNGAKIETTIIPIMAPLERAEFSSGKILDAVAEGLEAVEEELGLAVAVDKVKSSV
jgi:hypothetical protein